MRDRLACACSASSFLRSSIGIIAALGLSTLASAQSVPEARSIAEPNTVTVTPFLSGSFGTSDGLGGSIGLGVGVGYDFTRNLGVEGEIGHSFDLSGDDANLDSSATNYSANGIYHFDVRHFTPYATFGLGVEPSTLAARSRIPRRLRCMRRRALRSPTTSAAV